ncbi:MAG: acylneuraminate cytidylyltransferase family protein [Patescibacteria group bacterium]
MEILGIIPARGGSKSIPCKNIKLFCGKPLIQWTIDAGRAAGVLNRFILTTDDEEIARIGRMGGIDVPFIRPPALAEDTTPTLPVLQYALKWLQENEGYLPDYVVLLEPTSPGRRGFHIKEAVELLISSGADSIVSVCNVPGHFNPHWQFTLARDNQLSVFTGEGFHQIIPRRQSLPPTYYRNGAIYAFRTPLLFKNPPSMYGETVQGYVMEERYSLDIDTPQDWKKAETTFNHILKLH